MKNFCKFFCGVRRYKIKNYSNDEEVEDCDVKIVLFVLEVDLQNGWMFFSVFLVKVGFVFIDVIQKL